MIKHVHDKLSSDFNNFDIKRIESGASKKFFYRLTSSNKSFILTDFNLDKQEYKNNLYIYSILKKINITIPKIIESNDNNLLIISEDMGNLRFDKILDKYPLKELLTYAVDTLVNINNSIKGSNYKLTKYNFDIFKEEIMELTQYYFPYIKIDSKELSKDFDFIWSEAFNNIKFDFNNFCHKDFNLNNLILMPDKNKHLKCCVIDYQNAFLGESSWDLFSLLEDSRVLFTDEFNNYFIESYYTQTEQNKSLEEFKYIFNFLNASRQTRLLGRWIKLSKELNQEWYLNFIPITKKRLNKSLDLINNKNLSRFYNKYILN